ncbi:hypothetical protein ACIPJ2_09690 [Curtobacterium sp. NPDC090217]|uniref:hypothetical protein n=1 Tax=Curtobacterium sp. NPDC090217 TaxID=3363970 RepID=UPI0037FF0ECA
MGDSVISTTPDPGNPWPRDMLLTIENGAQTLLDLLWVREAWALDPVGEDLPPVLVDTPDRETGGSGADRARWSVAWPALWGACLAHAGSQPDPRAIERLHDPSIPQAERRALLEQVSGPSWRDEFGDAAFTRRYDEWTSARFDEITSPEVLRRSPERERLEQLVPAWRAGLTTIVEIPCRGTFTRRVGPYGLLVTAETRSEPDGYAAALSSFA